MLSQKILEIVIQNWWPLNPISGEFYDKLFQNNLEIFIQISAILEVLMNALLENLGKYNSCVRILVTFEFIIWRVLGYNVLIQES